MSMPDSLCKRLVIDHTQGIVEAMEMTDQLAELVGCSPRTKLMLTLATEEACTNTLEHGATKELTQFEVVWRVSKLDFVITVRQPQGRFVVPTSDSCVMGRRGRGLLLITEIMDHVAVKHSKDMVELVMSKRLDVDASVSSF
jgi:anti-sigma regulatory factor (Ser/Thr protein kinase)